MSFRLLTLLFWLAPPALVGAQEAPARGDSAAPVLRDVQIERQNIFSPAEADNWLFRTANALHVVTRGYVVRREVLLQPGAAWDSARAAETERNLRGLGIFTQVTVDSVRTDSGLVARVVTRDGWSTRPDFRFRSTGGQVEYTLAFFEDNLVGTATQVGVKYRHLVDRTSYEVGFLQPRLIANRVRAGMSWEDRSDGSVVVAELSQPFFNLESRTSLGTVLDTRRERVLRFFNGEEVASDTLERRYTLLRGDGGLALRSGPEGYLRAGFTLQVRRDDFVPEGFSGSFPDHVTGSFGPWLEWRRARYVVTRGFTGFGRQEDVDLSTTLRFSLLGAPRAFGYGEDGLGARLGARTGLSFPGGFGFLDAAANGLMTSAGLDSGRVLTAGTLVLQPGGGHTILLHADAGWAHRPLPGEEFDLGLGLGPRAFRAHALTGDRTFYATAEYRLTVFRDLLDLVGVGLAAFVDYGGAWYAGSPRRTGTDVGLGLRLGASRSSAVESLRIDLARRFANAAEGAGWVLVVGKGLTFSTSPLFRGQLERRE